MLRTVVLASLFFLLASADATRPDAWKAWHDSLTRTCPGNNVDLMGDGAYDEFLGAFVPTLAIAERRQLERIADVSRACRHERNGFGCEMSRYVAAAQQLGLLEKMVGFACREVKCEEGASCSRFPGRS